MKTMMMIFVMSIFLSSQASEIDVNTWANYQEVALDHLNLEWLLDLPNKFINGTAEYIFTFQKSNIQKITLDIYYLNIEFVYLTNGVVLPFTIEYPLPESDQGQRLVITLNRVYNAKEILTLRIRYSITTKSRAISFMDVEQTYTKTHPYLFSQCEDANCRALAPLQDTPAIKFTYNATILWKNVWQKDIDVFISADSAKTQHNLPLMGQYDATTLSIRRFVQVRRIPSYLIAIVAGNVELRKVGARTNFISEADKTRLDQYAAELVDMEEMLISIEKYIGPYLWGYYTLVIQPPSFPIGGMENPLLTFANPSIMTGDGSGLSVAIHEMAHSWFGNTVTCVNWPNMWINEGFTVFLERKASQIYYTQKENAQKAIDRILIDATTGNSSIYEYIRDENLWQSTFSTLHPDTTGINPDDTFSEIPYERGFQFLRTLELIVGESFFQNLLQAYQKLFAWKSIDQQDFRDFFITTLKQSNVAEKAAKINQINNIWQDWVFTPGMPPSKLDFSTQAITDAIALADAFITSAGAVPANAASYNQYITPQKYIFLQHLIDKAAEKITIDIIKTLDTELKLTESKNGELLFRWFKVILLAKEQDTSRYGDIIVFLQNNGRGKLIYPVYTALAARNLNLAQNTYLTAKSFYHPIARNNLEQILKIK